MKIFNFILGILFLLFAYFQINDPDPWLWVLMYAFVAVICFLAGFGRYSKLVTIGGIIVTVIWTASLLPEFISWIQMGAPTITESMKAEAPHIEFTREFLGLFLCMIVLSFQLLQEKKHLVV